MLGRVLTLVGGILLAIAGLMYFAGSVPLPWFNGLAYLVLGVGLSLFMRQTMSDEDGREAREKTESQRRESEDRRWREREQAEGRRKD